MRLATVQLVSMMVLFLLLLMPTEHQSPNVNASYTTLTPNAILKGIPHHCMTSYPNVSSTIFTKPLCIIFRDDIVDLWRIQCACSAVVHMQYLN